MASPADHLPKPVADGAINALLVSRGLPEATKIAAAHVTAQYHAIYWLTVPAGDGKPDRELVLRVSGNHLPTMKTRNEVGVMTWVSRHTSIPIPEIVAYDTSTDNPLGHEFTLLSRVPGKPLSEVYESLSEAQTDALLDQLIDWLVELHSGGRDHVAWEHLGGLRLGEASATADSNADVDIDPARIVDETFWQAGDLALWPAGETVASLNIAGPYGSWTALVSDQVRHYARLMELHPSLASVRDLVPRLRAFASAVAAPAVRPSLDKNTRPVLTHKDLHFANLLYYDDNDAGGNGRITAVLDWEFAGVVPLSLWDPRHAFLWNGRDNSEASRDEKRRWRARFEARVRVRGDAHAEQLLLSDQTLPTPLQDAMQNVADYVRAIVEVVPRGQRAELVPQWRAVVEANLAHFGV